MEIRLVIAGYILLLSIIGFFIVRIINGQDKINKETRENNANLKKCIEKLSITLTALNGTIISLETKQTEFEKRYDEHKKDCEHKFVSK